MLFKFTFGTTFNFKDVEFTMAQPEITAIHEIKKCSMFKKKYISCLAMDILLETYEDIDEKNHIDTQDEFFAHDEICKDYSYFSRQMCWWVSKAVRKVFKERHDFTKTFYIALHGLLEPIPDHHDQWNK